jgi:hypothetical protein
MLEPQREPSASIVFSARCDPLARWALGELHPRNTSFTGLYSRGASAPTRGEEH